MTRICIFGAGSIGGLMAAALDDAGAEVSLVARGTHLKAIRDNGLILRKDGREKRYRLTATNDPAELGVQDYVIVTLKAHSVPPIVEHFRPLLGPEAAIVPAVNGLPWWYFHQANTRTALDNTWIEAVDPDGAQWRTFGPERAIGCVVYPACEIPEPGVVAHLSGNRFTLGEPDGRATERLERLSKLLIQGGLKAPRKKRLRDEVWVKLWGNCSFNPVSALTGASLDRIGEDRACRTVVKNIMRECQMVGEAVGVRFAVDMDRRIDGAAEIIGHKPSTRQDVERHRPMELDALTSTVLELARRLDIATPILDAVAALVRMQGDILSLYERRAYLEAVILGR